MHCSYLRLNGEGNACQFFPKQPSMWTTWSMVIPLFLAILLGCHGNKVDLHEDEEGIIQFFRFFSE